MSAEQYAIEDLLRVMQRLREPETGCPWDLAQDFRSIVPSTLEECYELAEAIEHGDYPHVAEELGDVLFQVVFYAQLGEEQELFNFSGVVHTLVEKLVRRHPHVFADGEIEGVVAGNAGVDEVQETWEQIKASERAARSEHGLLDDVPLALPALPRAQKLQKRASRVGFDWPDQRGVMEKVAEELAELEGAVAAADAGAIEDEFGDLLFTCVNLGRHLGVDSEASLRRASQKFERRFVLMERRARARGEDLASLSDDELEHRWQAAKRSDQETR